MSTLGTFANFARYRMASNTNPVERLFKVKKPLLGRNSIDIIDEGAKRVTVMPRMSNKGGGVVAPPKDGLKVAYTGKGALVPTSKGGDLSWNLPDATKARAKWRKSNQALPAGEEKKGNNLGLILGLAGGGLAAAGGGATAIALANRKKKKQGEPESEAKMSSLSKLASFAEVDPFMPRTRNEKRNAYKGVREKEKEWYNKAKDAADTEGKQALEKQAGKYLRQRNIENIVDSEGGVGKAYSKGGLKNVGNVTTAILGNPERTLVNKGKASSNQFLRDLAEGVEGFGRLGYRAGATGGQKLINKVVGRTATGKLARLGAAGVGLSAIGGAMKRNRQENQ